MLGWGPRTPPLLLLSRCSNILSAPMGAIWPHLLLLRAYRLHTAGKGMDLSRSPSFSQITPWGVIPSPNSFPTPGRSNQDRRVDSVLQLWPQRGKEGSDRSGTVVSRALSSKPAGERQREAMLSTRPGFFPSPGAEK